MGKGVYLPSANLDSKLLVSSLRALLDVYPSVKFTSLNYDEKLHGYKIHFSEPDETVVLEKNYILVGNRRIWIYPLTTFLTIHGVPRNMSSSFKRELNDAISEKFGTVLEVDEVEQDWHVRIDIPEFRGLDILSNETFQDMTVSLPRWNEKFEVTVWCRKCKKSGHFHHECDSTEGVNNANSKEVDQSISKSSVEDPAAGGGEFSKFTRKSINSIAEKIGREEVLNSGIISDGNPEQSQKDESASSESGTVNRISMDIEIKKENGDDDDDTNEENKLHEARSISFASNENSVRNIIPKEESRTDEDSRNSFGEAASRDEDIQCLGISIKPHLVNASSLDSNATIKDEAYNSEDESRSPTNSRGNYSTPSFSETQAFIHSPVRPKSRTPKQPQSRVEVTSVLSDRLQDCINKACQECRILDRRTLDAFLIHVKKKSNPERVALNFTKNSAGLKEQLQKILHMYYNTPQTGTKEDMQFIKWLNGLVQRFDGTIPRKRKRNEYSSDDAPSKK